MAETIPEVIVPTGLGDYLEIMTRAVFQAGVSWKQIAAPWDAYRAAFENFDVARVADYGEADIERVLAVPGILRSPRKVLATVRNAQTLLQLDREGGGFEKYLHGFDGYEALAKELKRRFAFMGEMNAWYFLFRIGERVPLFESWVTTIPGEHPRMREMVMLARSQGRSRET
ncbi:MAG TPA: DNA-3-methyladenine glycosylase I [Candidatus Tyrphobacter sp.]